MKSNMLLVTGFSLLLSASCLAAAPAGAPAGTTGLCNDGSYYSGTEKKGACRGHKGVKDWYGVVAATAAAPKAAKTDANSKALPAVPVAAVAGKPAAAASAPTKAAGAAPISTPLAPTAKPSAPVVASPMTTAPLATPAKPIAPVSAPAASVPRAASGPGMVWANMDSKVYHCSTSQWYGKTKKGEYMTQSEAVAKGLRPDHGKACQ